MVDTRTETIQLLHILVKWMQYKIMTQPFASAYKILPVKLLFLESSPFFLPKSNFDIRRTHRMLKSRS
jgi:hypothetical protein